MARRTRRISDLGRYRTIGKTDFYDQYVRRCNAEFSEDRLEKILAWTPQTLSRGLDIGCGLGRNLRLLRQHFPDARLSGLDVTEVAAAAVRELGFDAHAADASERIPFADKEFDFVLCGEVIEHVIKTDGLLMEIRRVLKPDGTLILTTPNLAYVPNRLLLLAGVQPLFTETSQFKNLGRRLNVLGQGNETQGHLKIFTLQALCELFEMTGWTVEDIAGYRFFQSGVLSRIDAVFARVPSFAAGFVLRARPA